jgi:hypothetical protein
VNLENEYSQKMILIFFDNLLFHERFVCYAAEQGLVIGLLSSRGDKIAKSWGCGSSGWEQDWVLILDDAAKSYTMN